MEGGEEVGRWVEGPSALDTATHTHTHPKRYIKHKSFVQKIACEYIHIEKLLRKGVFNVATTLVLFGDLQSLGMCTCQTNPEKWPTSVMYRRKEERSKQGRPNKKAKQHSTPKGSHCRIYMLEIRNVNSAQSQLNTACVYKYDII